MENRVFHAEECIYNLQVSLSGSPFFVLSATIHAERKSPYAEHKSPCAKHDNSRSAQFPLGLELRLAR